MNRLVVYRNCFIGDVSGGDMHMSGFLGWLLDFRPAVEALLVMSHGDGQASVYPEVPRLRTVAHPEPAVRRPVAALYVLRALRGAAGVNKIVKSQDVLVASSHFLPDVLPVAFAKRSRHAKVVFIHHIIQDMERPANLNTRLANWQEKVCFALIRHRFGKVVVVNQLVADRLRQMGFTKQQILLSSNFVRPSAQPREYSQKDITLVFCGRMVRQKGVDDFVEVCRKLARTIKDFRAVMIGGGPELERIRQYVATEKLPIDVVGYVDDQTKFDLLSRAKLFVFPSVEEGWGIAIAEALAVGTPVVTYELPVYPAVFGDAVTLTPLRDVAGMTARASELLSQYARDPAAYQAEQDRITKYARQFSVEQVAAREYEFMSEAA